MKVRRQKRTQFVIADGDPRSLRTLGCAFIEWVRVVAQSEPSTFSQDQRMSYFIDWCEERGVTHAVDVTRALCERYQRALFHHRKKDGKPLGIASQASRLAAVRAFFRWAAKRNHVLFNPAADVDMPKMPHRAPRIILSPGEVEQILMLPDLNAPTGLRDRAMLETLYSTGIRRSELGSLDVNDVDVTRRTVFVREGKGKKDRMVPIGERALAFVEKYLEEGRPFLAIDEVRNLFVHDEGVAFLPEQLTNLVRRYVHRANLGKVGSCHLFRHTMATLMLEGGADIRFIQAILGHTKLTTTEIYTHVSILKLQQVHAATHPAATFDKHHDSETQQLLDDARAREELLATIAAEDEQ
jgi:integrase/recombinase XerD